MNVTSPTPPSSRPSEFALRPWEGLLLALLASAFTFGIVQATYPIFRMSVKVNVAMGRPTAEFLAVMHQNDRNDQKHAALYVGCLGFLTAGALSLRESIARRTLYASIAALPLGAAGGAVGGWLGCLIMQSARDNFGQAELKHLVESQLAAGLPLGLAVGLGLGCSLPSLPGLLKSALAGLFAGAIAATAYSVAVSVIFPTASTEVLLPAEALSRLFWLSCLAGCVGLIIPIAVRQSAKTTLINESTTATTGKAAE